MRLVKRNINGDGSGAVTLCPEEPEDMWHAYNLVLVGDFLTASAIRRVTTESASTGSTSSQRVHTNLTIKVKSLDFDPQAGQLHVSGQVARESKHAKMGQHHTLDLELNRNFTIEKVVEGKDGGAGWDSVSQTQLMEAIDPNKSTEAVAVVMQEGLGNICFLTSHQTILKQRVEANVPRKRTGAGRSADHDKGLQKFYTTVLDTLLRQLEGLLENKDSSSNFPILLASPGFVAQGFLKHINEAAASKGDKLLQELVKRKAFVVVHSSSGHLHSLNEVLNSPEVRARLQNMQYARETAVMDDFFTLLRKDDGRAWYGPKEVEHAVEKGAVGRGGGILLINNALFRSQDVGTRRRWVSLVDRVRDTEGGEVRILSSDHESGRRLDGLGGIAAILTFPIAEMDDLDDEEDAEE
ncbi:Translation factor pelota [Exophiala xenobiotica]|uniref:Protein DOM34 homolog n=1 Tax=Lithohypha guttulata TaxID=1690604 RepID=A0ABR0KE39_9EURO|nr:Translation factor pelota [Lithohypha guttulata]KAK5312069.1 Translation factor pelota [Exophiala xenobiotica]